MILYTVLLLSMVIVECSVNLLLYISSIVEMESKFVFLVLLFLLAESTTGLCVQNECCVIYVHIRLMF